MKTLNRILLTTFAGATLWAQTGQELFQQALLKERSQGDLAGAIQIYERILKQHTKDRKLSAQAMLQIAGCQERQGGENARRTYERLLKDYSDQPQVVAEARGRIAALAIPAKSAGPRVRQAWAGLDVDDGGGISPDGRYLSFANWETGDLGVRDLTTNTVKLLTDTGGWEKSGGEFNQDSRFSPDGKLIAYNWFLRARNGTRGGYEMRVMQSDGSGARTVAWAGGDGYPVPMAFSSDGRLLAVAHNQSDGRVGISIIDLTNGTRRELVPASAIRMEGLGSFSPDGKWLAYSASDGRSLPDIQVIPVAGGSPKAIAVHPGMDILASWTPDGRYLQFLSSRSGGFNVWRVPMNDGSETAPAQSISSDLGRSVRGIGFTAAGTLVYSIGAGGTDVYVASVNPGTARIEGTPKLISDQRPGGNTMPSVSPDGKKIAFRVSNENTDLPSLVVRDLTTGREKKLGVAGGEPVAWHPDGRHLVQVSLFAEAGTPDTNDLIWIDVETGERKNVRSVGPSRNPLFPVFSRDGKTLYFVFRKWPNPVFEIVGMDWESGNTKSIYKATSEKRVSLRGLTLSPDGKTLATIRRGMEGPKDAQVLLIPVDGGEAKVGASYLGSATWRESPGFSADGRGIFVVPTVSDRNPATEMLRLDLATGAAQSTGIRELKILNPSADPSGKRIYFQAGTQLREIWIAENMVQRAK